MDVNIPHKQQEEDLNYIQQTVFDLINDFKIIFHYEEEQNDLAIVEFFFRKQHPQMILKHLVKKLLPHKDQVKDRNIIFFDRNDVVFSGLPPARVKYYRDEVLEYNRLSEEHLGIVWTYLDLLIELSEPYIKAF